MSITEDETTMRDTARVEGRALVDKVKELIHEGNVDRKSVV